MPAPMLIPTQDLEALLGPSGSDAPAREPGLVLLDLRPHMAYLFSHIPKAVHTHWKEFSDPNLPVKSLLDTDLHRLEQKVGALGISRDHRVIVYADPFDCWGDDGRIYWMLTYLGHPSVQVLDGGWFKWKREGRMIERGPVKPVRVEFKARVIPEILAQKEEIGRHLSSPKGQVVLVDARSREEYLGLKSSGLPREGHIPGAVNIPWDSFYQPDGTVKSAEDIQQVAARSQVRQDQEVITYCTGGVRSAWLYFALKRAGFTRVKNYAGSWMEWSRDPELPVEK